MNLKNSISFLFALLCSTQLMAQEANKTQVVGAEKIDITERPFQVSLQRAYYPYFGHRCGAVIINERFILTSSSCALIEQGGAYANANYIVFGVTDKEIEIVEPSNLSNPAANNLGEYGQVVGIYQWLSNPSSLESIQNPNYDYNYRIGLLREPIQFNRGVQPVRVLAPDSFEVDLLGGSWNIPYAASTKIEVGDDAYISGWGVISDGENTMPDTLHGRSVTIESYRQDSLVFTSSPGPCDMSVTQTYEFLQYFRGDNGSPLTIQDEEGITYVAGLASNVPTEGNCENTPTEYTNVSHYEIYFDIMLSTCLDSVNVDDSIFGDIEFMAMSNLTVNSTFETGGKMDLLTGQDVDLLPGFSYDAGTDGRMYVEKGGFCGNNRDFILSYRQGDPLYDFKKDGTYEADNAELQTSLIENNAISTALTLTPNPASENVLLSLGKDAAIETVQAFDLSGKQVFAKQGLGNSNQVVVSLSEIKAGIYFVKAQDAAGNQYSEKLTIIK